MNHQCQHCGESTLQHYVCTITGNHYACEHPQWMASEIHRNTVYQSGPLAQRMPLHRGTHWHRLLMMLSATLAVESVIEIWTTMPWCVARYQNAEWGAHLAGPFGLMQVYSLIPYAECLLYQQWEHATPDDAGHIAVWPKYPMEGHRP